jgi:prevent-host-death family protein
MILLVQGVQMTLIPFSDARSCLTDVVNEVAYARKRVILTRKGKMIAAIVSLEDLEALQALECQQEGNVTRTKKRLARRTNKVK